MKKKIGYLGLTALMTVSLLAGCQGGSSSESTGSTASATSASADASSKEEKKEVVDLRMIIFGDMTTRREEFFNNELKDKMLEELSVNLQMEVMPWGSGSTTIQTMFASGEEFAVYQAPTADIVNKDYLAEIPEEMIDKLMPEYKITRGDHGYEKTTINDKIYAIPLGNKPYAGAFQTLMVRQDLLNEAGYTKEITTYDELMEGIAAVKAKNPNLTVTAEIQNQKRYFRKVISPNELMNFITNYVYVDELKDDDTVYSWYESEAFKNLCALNKEWVDLGYITSDVLSNVSKGLSDWKAGNCFSYAGAAARPMEELPTLQATNPDTELKLVNINGNSPLIYDSNYNTCIAFSATCEPHLDRYLEWINWMSASQENYDFMCYGVEGKDYKLEGEKVNKLVSDSFFDEWALFNIQYGRYNTKVSDDFIKTYKTNDEGSIKSKTMGFSFDSSTLTTQLSMMSAVLTEKFESITDGLVDFDENYDAAIKALKEAGLDDYMKEYQKQYSAWYAANK